MSIRFSVVIPVWNRANLLRACVDSVLAQTFTSYELIAVDDGSTDEAPQILKSYGDRLRVITQPNSGPEVARNTGAAAAHGEYLLLLDNDDILSPWALEIYDRIICTLGPVPLIVGSPLHFHDGEAVHFDPLQPDSVRVFQFQDYLSKTIPAGWITTMYAIRKSAYDEIGGYRNSDPNSWWGDGFDFVLRLGTHGPCVFVQQPHTFAYRWHSGNNIRSLRPMADGMLGVARSERRGLYPGGAKRRWERYAAIGGVTAVYALNYCWRQGQRTTALRLALGTSPMILTALVRKWMRVLREAPQPIIIPDRQGRVT